MASLDFGLSGTRMIAFGLDSEFSEYSKNPSRADLRFCAVSEALAVRPVPHLVPATLLALSLARAATASSFPHFSTSIFCSNPQQPIFRFMSSPQPLSPALVFFLASFERKAVASIPLATAALVYRDSLRRRAIMLSDSDPSLERRSISIGGVVGGGSVASSRQRTSKDC